MQEKRLENGLAEVADQKRVAAAGGKALVLARRHIVILTFTAIIFTLPLWLDKLSKPLGIPFLLTLRLVGIYTIAAVGLNLLMGYAGQVSLGQGAFFGIGAYTSALLSVKAGFPVWLGIIAAVLVSAIFGLMVAPVLRLKGHYLAMATLGLGIIVFVFMREFTFLTGGNDGITSIPDLSIPFIRMTTMKSEYYFVWIIAIIVLALCANIVDSRLGRALRALHQSDIAAEAMGVNVSGA